MNNSKQIELKDWISFKVDNWHQTEKHQFEIQIVHNAFKKMLVNQEKNIIQNRLEVHKVFEKKLKTDDAYDLYYAQYEEEFESHVNHALEKRFRFASFLSIIAYTESKLKDICNSLENEFKLQLKIKELRAENDLAKYGLFLKKIFKIEYSCIKKEFDKLISYYQIRNKIIHHDGEFIVSNQTDYLEIKKKFGGLSGIYFSEPRLKFNSNSQYTFAIEFKDVEFNENLLKIFKFFFENLIECIDKRIGTLQQIIINGNISS